MGFLTSELNRQWLSPRIIREKNILVEYGSGHLRHMQVGVLIRPPTPTGGLNRLWSSSIYSYSQIGETIRLSKLRVL